MTSMLSIALAAATALTPPSDTSVPQPLVPIHEVGGTFCGSPPLMGAGLKKAYGQSLRGHGVQPSGDVSLYVDPSLGAWTLTVPGRNGLVCIVYMGEEWTEERQTFPSVELDVKNQDAGRSDNGDLVCDHREVISEALKKKYGEELEGVGAVEPNNTAFMLYVNSSERTWTMSVLTPDNMECLIAAGEDWKWGENPDKSGKILEDLHRIIAPTPGD